MDTISERRQTFRRLHQTGCFVLPNPWDIGSARFLQHLGFPALATTSAGMAFAMGLPDNAVGCAAVLAHVRAMVEATGVPVNADFEAGFATHPDGVAENVGRCVEAGVAGLSIEDATGDSAEPLYPIDEAVARLRAARAAIDRRGGEVVLTGRSEGFLAGRPDLADTIRRLVAYAAAGADCLYAPGIRDREDIAALVRAVAPKPVNLLVGGAGLTVPDLAALGVRRISVGSALARAAWGAFVHAAREIQAAGRFDALDAGASYGELNAFFRDDRGRRRVQ